MSVFNLALRLLFNLSVDAINYNEMKVFTKRIKNWSSPFFDMRWKNLWKFFICIVRISFMITTKSIWFPSSFITTIAHTWASSLYSNLMPSMCTFFKTLLTNNASWIFLTCFTFPCDIFSCKLLCTKCSLARVCHEILHILVIVLFTS